MNLARGANKILKPLCPAFDTYGAEEGAPVRKPSAGITIFGRKRLKPLRLDPLQARSHRLLRLAFAAACVVFALSGYNAYQRVEQAIGLGGQAAQRQRTLFVLEELMFRAAEAQRGVRGYLITGDTAFAAPYRRAQAQIPASLNDLGAIAQTDTLLASSLGRLDSLAAAETALLSATVQLFEAEGPGAAREHVRGRAADRTLAELRAAVEDVQNRQRAQIWIDWAGAARGARNAFLVTVAMGLLALVLLGLYTWLLLYARRRRLSMESALRQSEAQFRGMVQHGADFVLCLDAGGIVRFASDSARRVMGVEPEDLVGRHAAWRVHPEDLPSVGGLLEQLLRGIIAEAAADFRVLHTDGSWKWVAATGANMLQDPGVEAVVISARDITERREAKEHLFAAQQTLKAISDNAPDLISRISPEGRFVFVSSALGRVLGVRPEQVLGRSLDEMGLPEEVVHSMRRRLSVLLATGEPQELEFVLPVHGEERYYHSRLAPERDLDGRVTCMLAITRDISERKAAEHALKAARRLAEEASQAKSMFLANMSHEIRTPMNGVVGMTDLLLDSELSPAQREAVDIIRASSQSLLVIINDILDFSKIEAGQVALAHEPFDLRACLEQTLDVVALAAAERGLTLVADIDPAAPPTAVGDCVRLRQIALNLVSNAVKFTDAGSVTLRADMEHAADGAAWLALSVADTGRGIDPEELPHLFERFRQGRSRAAGEGGTGLGLAIVQRLTELMGGETRAQSAPGVGSVFSGRLPMRFAPPPPAAPGLPAVGVLVAVQDAALRAALVRQIAATGAQPVPAETPEAVAGALGGARALVADAAFTEAVGAPAHLPPLVLLRGLKDTAAPPAACVAELVGPVKAAALDAALRKALSQGAPSPAGAAPMRAAPGAEAPAPSPLRVLLVEDNPINRKVARRLLERLGYACDAAADGVAALESVARRPYDVILMDVQMPRMDGLECTAVLRKIGAAPWIIGLTANALVGDRERYLSAGMNDYLAKPVTLSALKAALERAAEHVALAEAP